MPSLNNSLPSLEDPLREDLFLRSGAHSLAPLCPALRPCRDFREELLERLSAPSSQALLLPFAGPPPEPRAEGDGEDEGDDASAIPLLLLRRATLAPLGARLCEVRWPSRAFPRNPAVLSEALALALGAPVAELHSHLQRQLQQRPLVLLHPTLRDDFDEDAPLRYYTAWLPELLSKVRAQHALHALQPLSWYALSPARRVLARALAALWPAPPLASRRAVAERQAQALIDRLQDPLRQRRALPVRALPVLVVPRLRSADLAHSSTEPAPEVRA